MGVLAAPTANADQVWIQAVGRVSAVDGCVSSSADDLAAGWTNWAGSWEQWMNSGTGGYTCTRSITWAKDSAIWDACVRLSPSGSSWYLFSGNRFLPFGAPAYDDASCASLDVGASLYQDVAYAGSLPEAQAICEANMIGTLAEIPTWAAPGIYECVTPPG